MQIIALKEYTDKYISLYQGEIRNVSSTIASKLIEQGVVAEHGDGSDSEDNGSNEFLINITYTGYIDGNNTFAADKTFAEAVEAYNDGKLICFKNHRGLKTCAFPEFAYMSTTQIDNFQSYAVVGSWLNDNNRLGGFSIEAILFSESGIQVTDGSLDVDRS